MKTTHNFVANDLIWKDHIHKENTAAGQWNLKWGLLASFMSNEMNSQEEDTPKKSEKTTPRRSAKKSKEEEKPPLKLPPIANCGTPHKNSKPFPQTATQFIGWKAEHLENNLERYGKYTKPTKTFLAQMNWPYEAIV